MKLDREKPGLFLKGGGLFSLLFVLIALMGFVMIFNYNTDVSNSNDTQSVIVDDKGTMTLDSPVTISYTSYLIRVFFVVGLLVLVLYLVAKYFQSKSGSNFKGNLDLHILGKSYIGTKQSLLLVHVYDHDLLLGVTENAINLIKDFGYSELEETDMDYREKSSLINEIKDMFRKSTEQLD